MLLSGNPPFDGTDDQSILKQVKIGKYKMEGEEWNRVSNEAKDLIKQMLTFNPEERISAEEALKHPWFDLAKTKQKRIPDEKMSIISKKPFDNLRKLSAKQKIQQATIAFLVLPPVISSPCPNKRNSFKPRRIEYSYKAFSQT